MLVNIFKDGRVGESYQISFSFRSSKEYIKGLRERIPIIVDEEPMFLLSEDDVYKLIKKRISFLAPLLINTLKALLFRYWVLIANTFILISAWRGKKVDILQINNGGYPGASSARAAVLAARILKIPKVIMVVNNIPLEARALSKMIEPIVDFIIGNNVNIFVTGSIAANIALRSRFEISKAHFLSLNNGIGCRIGDELPSATRNRLKLAENQIVFLVVAHLEVRKGHRYMIEAVGLLKESIGKLDNILVIFEGSGPEEENLKDLVSEQGLTNEIQFIGSEKNIVNLLKIADVVVLPSIGNEDFPNIVLEAMSYGKLVIASSIAGIPEQITDGLTGILVRPKNAYELAEAMRNVISTPNLLDTLGQAAKAHFQKCFTAETAVSRYISLYEEISKPETKK